MLIRTHTMDQFMNCESVPVNYIKQTLQISALSELQNLANNLHESLRATEGQLSEGYSACVVALTTGIATL